MPALNPDGFVPLRYVLPWPQQLLRLVEGTTVSNVLDRVGLTRFAVYDDHGRSIARARISLLDEAAFLLPGLDGLSVVFGVSEKATGPGAEFDVDVELSLPLRVRLIAVGVTLRFDSALLKPMKRNAAGEWMPVLAADRTVRPFEFHLTGADILLDGDGDIEVSFPQGAPSFSMDPFMIGDSGIVVDVDQPIQLYLSRKGTPPAGKTAGFRGIHIPHASVELPGIKLSTRPAELEFLDAYIGSGGFSGGLTANLSVPGKLFGVSFVLKHVGLAFDQSVPIAMEIRGVMDLPFFDEPVDLDLGFDLEGNMTVALTSTGPDGLMTLEKPGLLRIELDSIAFEVNEGLFTVKISGKLTPLFGADKGLKWPTFDVKELSIDSKGHVHLDGGWLTLPQQQTLDFYGFKIEITQLGFGTTDDGGKWIGFSGGLKLVDGLQAGASVEGLRITWYPEEMHRDPKISFNGAGVELRIPDVLHLKGEVSYREITEGADTIHRFDGDIHLTLETPQLEIDGTLVIGSVKGPAGRYNFFAIYVDVELPTGIPLASTGLGIYGFAGLFALQMEPDKHSDEMWFSIDHSKSFYHRGTPGITDLKNKWVPRKGSFAVGAGITLGTLADNGYSFNGKFLLAIVIPGPIILIQGAASFLKKRADGADEGAFRALTVIDGRAGSLLVGLDAEYKTGKGGEMIEIGGSMEAFYAFHDPTAWHLWLGKDEPRELRLRALFGRFVEANAYFMLDAHALALGAWFGYANAWSFGPLSVKLEAWAEGNAKVSFKPAHFHAGIELFCLLELDVFGFGLGLSLDAQIAADLFKPYHLVGVFSVGIKVPFIKKIGATVKLEWGPQKAMPPLPLPLTEVAIEHLKSTAVWPLPRDQYLLPRWDDGNGFLAAASGSMQPSDPTTVPAVPMDARISLTFGRTVHDNAGIGVNPQQPNPAAELIGDPDHGAVASVTYTLVSLTLHRWNGLSWPTVAASPQGNAPASLFGSWMPVPQLPTPAAPPVRLGQTKLLVGSKTPFDFTRGTGSAWEEWVSDALPGYPCIPQIPSKETCFGFAGLKPGTRIESTWTIAGPPAFTLSWGFGAATVRTRQVTAEGGVRTVTTLCFPVDAVRNGIQIQSAVPGRSFRVVFSPGTQGSPAGPILPAPPGAMLKEIGTIDEVPTCSDLRGRRAGTVANPWSGDGLRFTVRGEDGGLLPVARFERWGQSPVGLNAGFQLDIDLPCASAWVELIVTHRPPFRIVAFNAAGAAVATHAPQGTGGEVTETIHLEGAGIRRLEVHAAGNEKLVHSVCYFCPPVPGPSATVYDVHGVPYGPFYPIGDFIQIDGPEISTVVVTGDGPLCLEQICVTPDPEAGQGVRRDEAIQHMQTELARWQAMGAVLAPHTIYALEIETAVDAAGLSADVTGLPFSQSIKEYAYFRTEGPPGLTHLDVPLGTDTTKPFLTGLEDLTRYVSATDPSTVPAPGEKPEIFEPFYRAYDLGVVFNEDYVEQMYRMERRDLGFYLFDINNQPVRDARGRLAALAYRWGQAETLTLSEKETRWLTLIDAATCLPAKPDPRTFPRDSTLGPAETDRVLAPGTLHEVRLVPLQLHEDFTGGIAGFPPPGWYAADAGPGGPSQWRLMEEVLAPGAAPAWHVEQAAGIGGSLEPDRPGTVLLLADPASAAWTDVRVSVYVRSAAGGAVGIVFRHGGRGSWYRFALHERLRRLVKATPAGVTVLAEDHFAWQRNRDYLLTVEAIGKSLRAYVDGEPVLTVEDGDLGGLGQGRIGLYVCQSPGARFSDMRVDDFRVQAPVLYRFQLTTSLYANFYHHLHSFEDETWPGVALGTEAAATLTLAVTPSFDPPKEEEARAYEDLAKLALGPAPALQRSTRIEVTRLTRPGGGPLLLLRSAEPLPPQRIELELSRPPFGLTAPARPLDLKMTEVTFGAFLPAEESVTILIREALAPTRHRIERRAIPGTVMEPAGDPFLLLESFEDAGAVARFEVVDQGTDGGPSQWQIEGGALLQTSGIQGGSEPALPGTQAVFGASGASGDPAWTDYRLAARLRSDAGSSVGLVFRWQDVDNHYRLSADAKRGFRRLIKREGGVVTVLWQDAVRYAPGEPFRLEVEAVGSRLAGWLDGPRLFEVMDTAHAAGRVGVYAWNDPTARCEEIEVRLPSLDARALLRDRFAAADLAGWSLASEASGVTLAQAAAMSLSGGALRLQSLVAQGGDPDFPGAYAVAGDAAWTDVVVRVRLRSKGGMVGVVFRGQNLSTYYRFAMSRERGLRELVRKAGGQVTVLWKDNIPYEADRPYELTVAAVGSSLRGWLDGVPLFAVEDATVPAGRIALYAWGNQEAWFSEVRVWPAALELGGWRLDEGFAALVPGRWSFLGDSGGPEDGSWTVAADGLRSEPAPLPWEEPGGGLGGSVFALAVSGGEVYAGTEAMPAGAPGGIAVWSGGAWKPLGTGVDGSVHALAVDGDRIYAGGTFTHAGGIPARNVAFWSRSAGTWSPLGGGVDGPVLALAVDGSRVYAGGHFANAGGTAAANVAVWSPQSRAWAALGGGVDDQVQALAAAGGRLYAGGLFNRAGGKNASRVARWDGHVWAAASGAFDGPVRALAVGEGGLYIAGGFTQAGSMAANRIARWTGTAWEPLGSGLDGPVDALALEGNQVWAAGRFSQAGGAPASRIARWNRAVKAWSAVAGGAGAPVHALAVDGGFLWAGGDFTQAGSAPARRIARLPLGGPHFALLASPGVEGLDAFRLAVRLVPAANGAAAVLLCFQDAAHHVALWLDAEHGFRRLVRTNGAQTTVLWEDAARPVAGREAAVTFDALGDRLTGFVDGVQLFDLALPALAGGAGRIGLAVRRSFAARFREVRLAEPAWTCWYAFGDEEMLLAGTRVRVHGAIPAAPPQEPGLTLRSAALTGESGSLRFRRQGAELRLVAPDGSLGHGRTFLPAETYLPVSVQALRKADGTGLVLVPGGDAGAGPLRLKLTYHRDRPEAGRAFSQGGDKGPEKVAIDIP